MRTKERLTSPQKIYNQIRLLELKFLAFKSIAFIGQITLLYLLVKQTEHVY